MNAVRVRHCIEQPLILEAALNDRTRYLLRPVSMIRYRNISLLPYNTAMTNCGGAAAYGYVRVS